MAGGWSYGEYVHRMVVMCLIYTVCCSVTWTSTVLLLKRVFQANPDDPTSKPRKWRDLQKTQVLGIVVCTGFSIALPSYAVFYIYYTIGRYRFEKRSESKGSVDERINLPGWLEIGFVAVVFFLTALLTDIYLNIHKLDVFDDTISEVSAKRKLVYRRVMYVIMGITGVYIALAYEVGPIIIPIGITLTLSVSTISGFLAYDFSVRLKSFIRVTRQSIANEREIGSRSVELSSSDSQMSAPNLKLLKVIIKQSLLSLTKIVSLIFWEMSFITIFLLTGVYFAYSHIFYVQVLSVLPLCVYLSFDFAQPEYHWCCQRVHNMAESRAIGSF